MSKRILPALLAAAILGAFLASPAQAAAPSWAPAATASITPGARMITGANQCTANFVFYDSAGNVYLGQAAHCSSYGDPSQTNGCIAPSLPVGTRVVIQGASKPGTLLYNSWRAMQLRKETDPNACAHNDFALVRVHPDDRAKVNPSMPNWGGPTGLAASTNEGDKVLTFGNSELRGSIKELKPLVGLSRGQSGDGWDHTVYTILPALPGDSGSGFLDGQGRAFGVLDTLNVLPEPLSGGVGDLTKSLDYANNQGGLKDVTLANGTEPFTGATTPLDGTLSTLDGTLRLLEQTLELLGLGLH